MCKRGSMGCHPFGHLAGHGGERRGMHLMVVGGSWWKFWRKKKNKEKEKEKNK